VLAVTAKCVIRDAISAGDTLELLSSQQRFVHAVAPMMDTDCAGAGHSIVHDERWALRSIDLYRLCQCGAISKMAQYSRLQLLAFVMRFACLVQPRVLRFGLLQNGNVVSAFFPEGEESSSWQLNDGAASPNFAHPHKRSCFRVAFARRAFSEA